MSQTATPPEWKGLLVSCVACDALLFAAEYFSGLRLDDLRRETADDALFEHFHHFFSFSDL